MHYWSNCAGTKREERGHRKYLLSINALFSDLGAVLSPNISPELGVLPLPPNLWDRFLPSNLTYNISLSLSGHPAVDTLLCQLFPNHQPQVVPLVSPNVLLQRQEKEKRLFS